MIQNEDNPENSVLPFLIPPLIEPRVSFYQKLIANLFEKGETKTHKRISRCKNQKTTS